MGFLIVTAYIENAPDDMQDRLTKGPIWITFDGDDMVEVTISATIGSYPEGRLDYRLL